MKTSASGNLVLSRKSGETIYIGDVEVMVLLIRGSAVKLAIKAPRDVEIVRGELKDKASAS